MSTAKAATALEALASSLGWLTSREALLVALLLGFIGLLTILLLVFMPRGDPQASRTLRRGVTVIERMGEGRQVGPAQGFATTQFGERAVDLVSSVPRPSGYDERIQVRLDRAGWQLRSTEFLTLRIIASIMIGLVAWGLTNSLLAGLLGAVVGALVPAAVLSLAIDRRQSRFLEQLPDTLQLLAGTLKAGYGVLQAIDTVVKEVDDPMSSEFQRALTEARLGLPLDESLGAMADRVGSDDFRWVVVAINIQRQVGGNLAELLETVAETLRSREQVRRQVKVLSAEGRLSAVILIALPFVLLGAILLTNAEYLQPLFTSLIGYVLIAGAAILMIVGVLWIRRIVRIEV